VGDAARAVADLFCPADPAGSLAESGVELRVHGASCRFPGKRVFGLWDPLLRRVEMFECHAGRTDREMVRTLGHELAHVYGAVCGIAVDEDWAERFAEVWVALLGPIGLRRCAAALRALAESGRAKVGAASDRGTRGRTGLNVVSIGL